ncbi:MAG: DUF3568 family protein [Thermodesulfobacteriota bacterium]|nr:DUF3568 family protein [Thermodesulfobacteriota bacterium]
MNYLKKGLGLVLMASMLIGNTGCAVFFAAGAGVGVGIGAAEYIRGDLKQAYAAPMEKAWNASLAAVEELKMKATEKAIDNLDQNRVIKGVTEEGKDFQIALEALAKDVTMARVRIGIFGDEAYSKKIQEGIAKNLIK